MRAETMTDLEKYILKIVRIVRSKITSNVR